MPRPCTGLCRTGSSQMLPSSSSSQKTPLSAGNHPPPSRSIGRFRISRSRNYDLSSELPDYGFEVEREGEGERSSHWSSFPSPRGCNRQFDWFWCWIWFEVLRYYFIYLWCHRKSGVRASHSFEDDFPYSNYVQFFVNYHCYGLISNCPSKFILFAHLFFMIIVTFIMEYFQIDPKFCPHIHSFLWLNE